MLNNLKKVRDTLSEKTKLLIYVVAAAAVFITSCVLPLAFRGDSIISPDFKTGERAAMFVNYTANDKSIRFKIINDPDKSQIKFCEEKFDELAAVCILDTASRKSLTEGKEYITLSDGENTMQLCHMWLQDQGDWTNWIEVYMDAETGFIYYLYISSNCITNGDDYFDAVDDELSAKSLASLIAKETGYELKVLNWSGKSEDAATVYTARNGEALVWTISCFYYPSSMLDLKISVN